MYRTRESAAAVTSGSSSKTSNAVASAEDPSGRGDWCTADSRNAAITAGTGSVRGRNARVNCVRRSANGCSATATMP